ncbi:cytochrome c oxidase assembly protein [Paludibaculum fermentans]|uniref:cytochrome c oxidase assembly protein n=1 Tax=Paludibaculum fermentans TaxID=1473598 RepID=UPI003EBC14F7
MKHLSSALGAGVLWIAIASPLSHLDHHLLTAHMVQHLLIMLVAGPLILLGARSIVVRWHPHPVFCWLAGTLTVIVWHVPAVFEMALRSHWWHTFEQVTFFVAGILFWWPVIQLWLSVANSIRWLVPVYLLIATLPCDALSAFLAFCGYVVYRPYLHGGGHFGLEPLEDQVLAAALMWVAVTFAYLIPALVVTGKLLSGERKVAVQTGV